MALLVMEGDPAWHDEETAVGESVLMLIASIETSGLVITHAVDELSRWLTEHPEDVRLATELEFLSNVLQEALRLNPVAPHLGRQALEDLQLSTGRVIKKGQWIAGINKLANTDEKVFGPDAKEFNPHRTLPLGVPRYGVGFGAGTHQCIGLRIVLGNTGVGSHTHVLRELYIAGVEPDREHAPQREHSNRGHFDTYPVTFRQL
jgi:cytochrome P450